MAFSPAQPDLERHTDKEEMKASIKLVFNFTKTPSNVLFVESLKSA